MTAKLYLEQDQSIHLPVPNDLIGQVEAIKAALFAELWIEPKGRTDSLSVLTNREHGFLTYFRDNDGDSGLYTRNKTYCRTDVELQYCTLSGCGGTPLPARFSLSIDDALKVAAEFFETGTLPTWVDWVEIDEIP